jgi:hypothetical protein
VVTKPAKAIEQRRAISRSAREEEGAIPERLQIAIALRGKLRGTRVAQAAKRYKVISGESVSGWPRTISNKSKAGRPGE